VHSTDDKQMYTAAVNVGTTVRTACSNHPVNGAGMQGIYYGEINTTTGAVTGANGAALGTLGTEINHSALQTVYLPAAGWSTWIYDVGDNPSIRELTFVEFDPANKDTTATYKYARWSGSAWVVTNIVAAGKRFNVPSGDAEPYFGSVQIPRGTPGGVVYLARESSGTWSIERRTSADSGATWTPTVLRSLTEHPRQNVVRAFPVEGDGSYPAEVVYVQTFRWSTYEAYRSDFVVYPEPVEQSVKGQTATTYTLSLTDNGKLVTLSNAAAITVTVPTNAAVALPVGASIDLLQLGAGQITVSPAGGVTVNKSMATAKSRTQYSVLTLTKIATDTWVLSGDAAAS
jgi:hypothetical protein